MNGFVIRRSIEVNSSDIVKSKDTDLRNEKSLIEGSKRLCKAILDTKKVYRKMTKREIDEAIEYADNVTVVRVGDE